MANHAALSPSSFKRVMQCPASFVANLHAPRTSSAAADRGTQLHELAEKLINHLSQDDNIQFMPEVAAESDEALVRNYVNYCLGHFVGAPEHSATEVRVDLSCITPIVTAFGTCDFITYNPNTETLEIVDLKTGNGKVSANNNVQLSLYAIGAVEKLVDDGYCVGTVITTIHQGGAACSEQIDIFELLERKEKYIQAMIAATSPNPKYAINSECTYCPFMARCPAQYQSLVANLGGITDIDADLVATTDPTALFPMVDLLSKKKQFVYYLESIETFLENELKSGHDVSGVYLRPVKGREQWVNEQSVVNYIFETYPDVAAMFVRPVTITEMRKLLGDVTVAELTAQSPASLRIAVGMPK